jgi:RNA polymerase sigma-70 factor
LDYQGRSSLGHWVGIVALRMALQDYRREDRHRRMVQRLYTEPIPALRGPEESLVKERYRAPIEAALRGAVAALTGRQRVVMRLQLCGRASAARIARIYGVSEATVWRWLSRARTAIWDEVQRRLRAELGLLPADLESLLRNVASQLDASLSAVLATGRREGRGAEVGAE